MVVVLHLELCKGSGICLTYTVYTTTVALLQWSGQSAQFRFCISWMDWTCCSCAGISVQPILFRQLYAACLFWECKKCQLYRSPCINVTSMVKAICANVIWCWQARSLCDLFSLMACGDKERENDCSGRLLVVPDNAGLCLLWHFYFIKFYLFFVSFWF